VAEPVAVCPATWAVPPVDKFVVNPGALKHEDIAFRAARQRIRRAAADELAARGAAEEPVTAGPAIGDITASAAEEATVVTDHGIVAAAPLSVSWHTRP